MPTGVRQLRAARRTTGTTGGTRGLARAPRDCSARRWKPPASSATPMEWWHYDLPGATKLPVLDVPFTKDTEPSKPPADSK